MAASSSRSAAASRRRHAGHWSGWPEKARQRGLGPGAPGGVAGEVKQPGEDLGHDAVAGGRGVVGGGARAGQRHVGRVGGGGVEAAMSRRRRRRAPHSARRFGGREVGWLAGRLVQRQRGAGHRRLVLDQAGGGDAAQAPGVLDAAVAAGHVGQDEVEGLPRAVEPGGLVEHRGGAGQGGDRQAVPVGQHLVVPAGADAFFSRLEQDVPSARPGRLPRSGVPGGVMRRRIVWPSQLPSGGDVVGALEGGGVGPEQGVDLGLGPDVEAAFLALAVGVLGGGEGGLAVDPLRASCRASSSRRFPPRAARRAGWAGGRGPAPASSSNWALS